MKVKAKAKGKMIGTRQKGPGIREKGVTTPYALIPIGYCPVASGYCLSPMALNRKFYIPPFSIVKN